MSEARERCEHGPKLNRSRPFFVVAVVPEVDKWARSAIHTAQRTWRGIGIALWISRLGTPFSI